MDQSVVVARFTSETNRFLAGKKIHVLACSECKTLVRYLDAYNEEILAKERCLCLERYLVGSVINLPQKETNKFFTNVFQIRLLSMVLQHLVILPQQCLETLVHPWVWTKAAQTKRVHNVRNLLPCFTAFLYLPRAII